MFSLLFRRYWMEPAIEPGRSCLFCFFVCFFLFFSISGGSGAVGEGPLAFFDGCPPRLGCTVLLRGASRAELARVEKVGPYRVLPSFTGFYRVFTELLFFFIPKSKRVFMDSYLELRF